MKSILSEEIFQKYLQRPNLFLIYTELPDGQLRLIEITKKILRAIHNLEDFPEFSFEDILKNESKKDIGAYFLFLYVWSIYSHIQRYYVSFDYDETTAQCEILFKKAKNLENFTNHPAHKFMLSEFEALHEFKKHNFSKARKVYRKLFIEAEPKSILYYRHLFCYLNVTCAECNIKEFNKVLETIKNKKEKYHQHIYEYFKFYADFNRDLNHDLTAQYNYLKNNLHFLKDIGFNKVASEIDLEDTYYLHQLAQNKAKLLNTNIKMPDLNRIDNIHRILQVRSIPPIYKNVFCCSAALIKGETKEALEYLKPFVGRQSPIATSTFIKAALANRNAELARYYLRKRNKKFASNFINDFYLARIHLIEGNKKLAQKFIKKSISYAKRYDCLGHLEFEFTSAYELKGSSMFDLLKDNLDFSSIKLTQNEKKSDQLNTSSDNHSDPLNSFLGSGPWYDKILNDLHKLSNIKQTVLIHGETGTGKDILARSLHHLSNRSEQPFVSISCGSLQETLLETEIFGHVKGAFTGAEKAHHGLIEQAKEGTLFLDEIADLPPKIQTALLRILENKEFRPIGATHTKKANCHIICTTNKDLREAVKKGTFRQDLFFRLTPLTLYLPPLRERQHDIKLLAEHFLKRFRKNQPVANLDPDLLEKLKSHSWPGNVRELKNEIEYMALMDSSKSVYTFEDLREEFAESIGNTFSKKIANSKTHDKDSYPVFRNDRLKEELKNMFLDQNQLTRIEICKILNISHTTASKYLKILREENFIEKITPSGSSRFNYFVCCAQNKKNNLQQTH